MLECKDQEILQEEKGMLDGAYRIRGFDSWGMKRGHSSLWGPSMTRGRDSQILRWSRIENSPAFLENYNCIYFFNSVAEIQLTYNQPYSKCAVSLDRCISTMMTLLPSISLSIA